MAYKQKIYLSVVVPSALAKDRSSAISGGACNQKCPSCALIRSGESEYSYVTDETLRPEDTIRFINNFYEGLKDHYRDGQPFSHIAFHGYEVTIPQQWEWVERIVSSLPHIRADFEFITNGMLLYRYRKDVVRLGIKRITVSIDGDLEAFNGLAYINDMYRGLPNATLNTCVSLTRFVYGEPSAQWKIAGMRRADSNDPAVRGHDRLAKYYKNLIGVNSVLYGPSHPVTKELGHNNFESLKQLPATMAKMGIGPWTLSPELVRASEEGGTCAADDVPWDQMAKLAVIANACGVTTYVNDVVGAMEDRIKSLEYVHDLRYLEDEHSFTLRFLAGSGHISSDYRQPISKQLRLGLGTNNAFEAVGGLGFFADEYQQSSIRKSEPRSYWGYGLHEHNNIPEQIRSKQSSD